MTAGSDDERRTARRFQMELPVEVNLPSAGEPSAASARTRDVSFRGLYFTLDRELEVGSRIDFVLTLPREITLSTDVRVRCVGRVVRVNRDQAAHKQEREAGGGQIGVAAVIEQYSFLSSASEESSP